MINTDMPTKTKNNHNSMRLDKWLWCARFFKTRRQATEAIKSGKIKSLGNKVKPSHDVKPGEVFSIKRGPYTYEITVQGLASHRRSASEAILLYTEKQESKLQREQLAEQLKINNALMPHSRGRPTKRERRKVIRFTRKASNSD